MAVEIKTGPYSKALAIGDGGVIRLSSLCAQASTGVHKPASLTYSNDDDDDVNAFIPVSQVTLIKPGVHLTREACEEFGHGAERRLLSPALN